MTNAFGLGTGGTVGVETGGGLIGGLVGVGGGVGPPMIGGIVGVGDVAGFGIICAEAGRIPASHTKTAMSELRTIRFSIEPPFVIHVSEVRVD